MHVTPPAADDGTLASFQVQALLLLSRGLRRVFGCEGATVVLGGWLDGYRLAVWVIRLLKKVFG